MTFTITPISKIPFIRPGNNLADIILNALSGDQISLIDGDIIVLSQKIVSKVEGRIINLSTIIPSKEAEELALISEKDARLVELILQESKAILRIRPGTLIVEHKLGFICASAGIDHSNVHGDDGNPEDWVLLLPENPDLSADKIRQELEFKSGKHLGVMIIDSHGRAWRLGVVGTCIGLSGIPALIDQRGKEDLFGYKVKNNNYRRG